MNENNFTLEGWRAEQERLESQSLFCALWQWLVILASIALVSY